MLFLLLACGYDQQLRKENNTARNEPQESVLPRSEVAPDTSTHRLFQVERNIASVKLSARVVAIDEESQRIFPPVSGWVIAMLVQPGDAVSKHQRLARVSTTYPINATLTPWFASAGAGEYWIVAPRSGTVFEIASSDRFSPVSGTPLVTIGDLSRVYAIGRIHVSFARDLAPGREGYVYAPGLTSARAATIKRLGTMVDPSTQTVELVASVRNERNQLQVGQFLELEISLDPSPHVSVIRIPANTLRREGQLAWVLVEDEGGVLQKRLVQPGRAQDDWIEIEDGLLPGEQVAVDESA